MDASSATPLFEPDDVVDYFELPEKRVPLNFKVPESLKREILDLVRLWKMMAELRGTDPSSIDITHVCTRLLTLSVEGAWGQVGNIAGLNGKPTTEEEWERLAEAMAKRAAADKATRGKK